MSGGGPVGGARLSATPAGVKLCPVTDLPDETARGFVLQMRAGRFHGFVVRQGEMLRGYVDRCPHAGLPLARRLDAYLVAEGQLIACGWHGALFTVEDGHCVGGPCAGRSLRAWPVGIAGGWIVTN